MKEEIYRVALGVLGITGVNFVVCLTLFMMYLMGKRLFSKGEEENDDKDFRI